MFLTKSKIFLLLNLSFIGGIFIGSFLEIPFLFLLTVMIFSITFLSIFWQNKKVVLLGFCLIFLAIGIYRYVNYATSRHNTILRFNDTKETLIFRGIVIEEPEARVNNTQYLIEAQEIKIDDRNWQKVSGKILVTLSHWPKYKYGDLIQVNGELKSPQNFGSFSYREYLAKDDVYSVMYYPQAKLISQNRGNPIYQIIFVIKNKFEETLSKILSEPELSLLNGLLLGARTAMPQELKDAFSATGTSHIVAVSGFNVTIIAFVLLYLALAIGLDRSKAFYFSIIGIVLFIIMIGAPASAVRAGVMGSLVLLATKVGRFNRVTNAIILAASAMLFINPRLGKFDIGFQLSFLAVLGIIYIFPILDELAKKIPDVLKIKSIFLVTIAAQIATAPIIVYNFQIFSLIAPLANILILPFIPLAMALGFLAGLLGLIWLALGQIIAYGVWLILTYQIKVIEFFAKLPCASMEIFKINFWWIILYYIGLAILIFFWQKKIKIKDNKFP